MVLPNYLIVGAPKSGTTSLYYYLKQHPDVFMPETKEPHYFSDMDRYVTTLEEYEALFSTYAGEKAVGEASTGYLFDEQSPGWIKRTIPEVKIIILLRNPPDMAHSLWRHMTRGGRQGERRSFKSALRLENKRMHDPNFRKNLSSWHANFYYFHRALYYEQVKRYIDTFGRDKVLVFLFDDFKADPLGVCRKVFEFINVDPGFTPIIKKHNVGWAIRHRGLNKLLEKPPGYLVELGNMLPNVISSRIKEFFVELNKKPPPKLDVSLRRELLEQFRPDIDNLGKLIGRDLSLWYRQVK